MRGFPDDIEEKTEENEDFRACFTPADISSSC